MSMPDEEEVIVAIPDDTIQIGGDDKGGAGDPAPTEKATPAKDEPKVGWRASSLAKDKDKGPSDADRISAIERERDEAARSAEEARARAAEAEARAEAEAAARMKAEGTSQLREQQAMNAHWHRLQSDKGQIEAAITATLSESQSIERDLIAATETGDAVKAAAAQRALAKAEAALAQLEQGKSAADAQIEEARRLFDEHARNRDRVPEPKPVPVPKKEPPPVVTQTADQWIDTTAKAALGDAGATWLRENKTFVTDAKENRRLLAFADLYAIEHGASALKSEAFIEALNDKFFPDRDRDTEPEHERAPEPERPRARTQAAAPVSRSGNQFFSSRNLNATQVKLPPRLAAFVKASGLNATEYALGAVADIKAGRLPKNFLDPDYDPGI